uniref:NADH dehydrogenase [ubiquinone] 1 alpha subcomplex subunit 12 n=1 Tax=Mesocestoides corti TaxID=53468 RepID=A0A5K3ESI0_MESCO
MAGVVAKISKLFSIIKQNGGIRGSIVTLFRTDELKDGTLVGEDYLGNKYYENNRYFLGRNRWVVYGNRFGWDYEASQVPPEWHRWLHYMTDETPIANAPERQPWMLDHQENVTLQESQKYIPYSTTKPKITAWSPK